MKTKQFMSFPKKIIAKTGSAIKTGAKTAMSPASPSGTWQFVLGALLGAPVSSVYSFVYDETLGKLPIPADISKAVKILAPLVPIYFVKTSQIPFGNIINGTLAGVVVAQGLDLLFNIFAGESIFGKLGSLLGNKKDIIDGNEMQLATGSDYADF